MNTFLKHLSPILISLITIRGTVFGFGIGEALAILSVAGLVGYDKYLSTKNVSNPTEEIKADMEKLRNEMGTISLAISQRSKPQPMKFNF